MKTLYIGGTGEISYACVQESLAQGHSVTVLNRGQTPQAMPPGVRQLFGDLKTPEAYRSVAAEHFDCVCQFVAFEESDVRRDVTEFSGRTGQYLFVSTASAYSKPLSQFQVITEDTELANPYWEYSQKKIRMEALLREAHDPDRLPVTIVRPSHTYRRRFPSAFGGGYWTARRMLAGAPVIVHGDGSSLWTLTHAEDFARPFVGLLGNPKALGADFHITGDGVHSWDEIFHTMAAALGVSARLVHIASDTLIQADPCLKGRLLGDKAPSTIFDNSKVQEAVGAFDTEVSLPVGFASVAPLVRAELERGAGRDSILDGFVDTLLAIHGEK